MEMDPDDKPIRCPVCRADTFYRYGRDERGRQRYLCLCCNHQFIPDARRMVLGARPDCPACGRKMHLYRRSAEAWRFRCSDYPRCRHYLKLKPEEIR